LYHGKTVGNPKVSVQAFSKRTLRVVCLFLNTDELCDHQQELYSKFTHAVQIAERFNMLRLEELQGGRKAVCGLNVLEHLENVFSQFHG